MKLLLSLYWPTLFILVLSLHAKAQCSQSDIVITTNTTWTNQDVQLTNNQKITVTSGATLTMVNCTLHRKTGCSGYWDGIYLVTAENGAKAGLVANSGTRIEYSRNGIQALNGFSQITLDEAEMSDNGAMIHARDNWPFTSFTSGFASNGNHSRDGGAVSVYDIGCDELLSPYPPKVIIRNNSILKVLENGNASINPAKYRTQINVLGAELNVISTVIVNGTPTHVSGTPIHITAIASSRGKCKMSGDSINGFWTGVYKGSDQSALCVSEGLVLTGSKIINTDLTGDSGFGPGWAVMNMSADAMIRHNVLEGNVWSFGTCYGTLYNNNISYLENEEVGTTSLVVANPRESFVIFDNKFNQTPTEFEDNNRYTNASCNKWVDETDAVVAGYHNLFPMSWGTASSSAGNLWETTQSGMYNLSFDDDEINYYYRSSQTHETFYWYTGFSEHNTTYANSYCTYTWPTKATGLDPDEYERDMEDLTDEYEDVQASIESIIGHMDTTVLTVKEELAYLKSRLSDLVGQGLLFHTTTDDDYWTDQVDSNVVELLGLNYLWFGHDMFSVQSDLESNSDPDAEALYDAAGKMSDYFDNGKNLCNLTALQVDTLHTIAESSFGNYTNILRNYLYMVYDDFIPYERHSLLDSLRSRRPVQRPSENPFYTFPDHTVGPNPFTDNLQIQAIGSTLEENTNHIYVYNLEGKLVYSSTLDGNSGHINLSALQSGFYILKMVNDVTGKIEIKRIYKDHK